MLMIPVVRARKHWAVLTSVLLSVVAGTAGAPALAEMNDSGSVAVQSAVPSGVQREDNDVPAVPSEMEPMRKSMQTNLAGLFLMNQASGTSMNPRSWPMPMLMSRLGSWNAMFMGQAYVLDTQQT